jgi:vacuolar-type H+-ATPase subunit C/Vma6
MAVSTEQPVIDFNLYPPVGDDDWNYTFATAKVRALETQMLNRPTLIDMANAADFTQAVELLSSSEYSMPAAAKDFGQVENTLLAKRAEVRELFKQLITDEHLIE